MLTCSEVIVDLSDILPGTILDFIQATHLDTVDKNWLEQNQVNRNEVEAVVFHLFQTFVENIISTLDTDLPIFWSITQSQAGEQKWDWFYEIMKRLLEDRAMPIEQYRQIANDIYTNLSFQVWTRLEELKLLRYGYTCVFRGMRLRSMLITVYTDDYVPPRYLENKGNKA